MLLTTLCLVAALTWAEQAGVAMAVTLCTLAVLGVLSIRGAGAAEVIARSELSSKRASE